MEDTIIQLEMQLAYQREDIDKLSSELFAQQKEIAQLKKLLVEMYDKVRSMEANRSASDGSDEPPPPHY